MSEAKKELLGKEVSRRKFIVGASAAGVLAAGGVLGVAGTSLAAGTPVKLMVNGREISGPVATRIEKNVAIAPVRSLAQALGASVSWDSASRAVTVNAGQAGAAAATAPAWPYPYKKLDPEVVRKRGYELYFKGGCMFAAASAILITLQEEVGYPYTTIPTDIFKYGAGGVASWGTLCGALNGASAVFNMVSKDFGKLCNELFGWYSEFPFPSDKHEAYCKFKGQVTTVSKSPLCHASVSLWSSASGKKVNSDEKKDRCAKLSGDTAAKAVEMLNAAAAGNFIPAYKPSEEFAHCVSCHQGKDSVLDNEQGLMNCTSCHDGH